ncbi:amidohydrolase family protein [Thalassotalea sp. LPB0316]|nr:amidohydrolase family protein [Thalassotalea sp. LPB0316]
MSAKLTKINAHGHLLPYPEQIPAFMREKKYFWVDDERQFMHQNNWRRPITDASFFLNEKIEWMAKHQIEHEVVLNLSQLYCNGVPEADALDILRFQNDFNAQVQDQHPDKFTTGFVVQPAYIDQALAEIIRCVEQHKMRLLCLSTHYLNHQGEWVSVADESCEAIWQLADKYQLAVEIHPYDAGKMVNLQDVYWRNHLVWMMAQTADTFLMFSLKGFAQKYPNVRTCFAHGAMLAQANIARVNQGVMGRPDLFPDAHNPNMTMQASNVYFDSLVHDPLTLEMMIKRVGSSQILWGVDDPYPLGEMETVQGCYPGVLLDEIAKQGVISDQQKQQMMSGNILAWLGT